MKYLNITPAGALIASSRYTIPSMAKAKLGEYANGRLKNLKIVTKAFKYTFPFYDSYFAKKAFNKFCSVLVKALYRKIPYLNSSKVGFIDTGLVTSDKIIIRLGPCNTGNQHRMFTRYARKIHAESLEAGLPLTFRYNSEKYMVPAGTSRYARYSTAEEIAVNTYDTFYIKITIDTSRAAYAYLLFYHLPEILKCLNTLHRHAHYAETTHRGS